MLNHHRGGSGEPLVLVHGIASRWQAWQQVVPALEARHEVLVIDLPGFGASPPDGTEPTIEGQADRVERFFAEAGVERPHVAGFSMGGGIALELARRGAVRSATALAPVGFWTPQERRFTQDSLRRAVQLGALLRPALPALVATAAGRTALFAQNYGRPWRLPPGECLETIDAAIAAPQFEPALRGFDRYVFHDAEELRDVPVTIVWGERDRLLLYGRQAPRARRVLPWARHVTLAGCGHVPFHDDPQRVAEALLAGAAATAIGAAAGEPAAA